MSILACKANILRRNIAAMRCILAPLLVTKQVLQAAGRRGRERSDLSVAHEHIPPIQVAGGRPGPFGTRQGYPATRPDPQDPAVSNTQRPKRTPQRGESNAAVLSRHSDSEHISFSQRIFPSPSEVFKQHFGAQRFDFYFLSSACTLATVKL